MSFENDVKAGTNAERIFYMFEGRFSRRNILWPTWEAAMHITGKDFQELVIADEGIRTLKTEVKACLSNHFIERNNNPRSAPDPGGTLEFELWSNAWDENKHRIPRERWTAGWFQKILHPERYNVDKKTVEKPSRLVFMLCADSDGLKPYVCVNFEKFDELEDRLRQIAPFSLDDIPSPTLMDKWNDEAMNTPYNSWYVPFDKVKDLATITRILDNPIKPGPAWRCPLHIQYARCENLMNSINNSSFDSRVEVKELMKAAKAHIKELGLPEDAPLPHMVFFDSKKLPEYATMGTEEELQRFFENTK